MKAVRSLVFALIALPAVAFSQQSSPHNHDAQAPAQETASGAQKAFAMMKVLAGEWEGAVKTDMPGAGMDAIPMHVTMRVTSRGNVVVHEFQQANTPLDPDKYDHPVTMMYVDDGQLNLVHYCDAGNRPRMTGKMSSDGKKVEFDFADIGGSTKYGHMHQSGFTIIDQNRHIEEWTFVLPSGQVVHAKFDLHRVN